MASANAVPFASLVAAFALMVAVLPSALRPPPDPATTAAEFSPDAPPEEQQDSIVAALNRGVSGTAGTGAAALGAAPEAAMEPPPPPPEAPPPPRMGRCFGDPPRQTESVYSPPCSGAFVGDNGGATYKGVTATEVRLGIITGPLSSGQRASYTGRVFTDPQPAETAQDRTYRVMQAYFNQRYQLYGRRLQLVHIRPESGDEGQRAAVQQADEVYGVFGVVGQANPMQEEAIRRKLVAFGTYQNPKKWYLDRAPYAWSWNIDADQLIDLTAELLCKQAVGKPATFTDDSTIAGRARKFGVIAYDDAIRQGFDKRFEDAFARQCGGKVDARVVYNLDADADETQSQNLSTAVVNMRAAEVTTVVCLCDFVTPAILTQQATQQNYFPEWVMTGAGEMDRNGLATLYDRAQWNHAFGITALEMARFDNDTDAYRAYHEIDPDGDPHDGVASYVYSFLQQVVGGLQQAGPSLTPEAFAQGMLKWPQRPPDPEWAVAGGFSSSDHTFADYVSLVWWDVTATDPTTADGEANSGAYRHLLRGRRFTHGEIPTEPLGWFKEGVIHPDDPGKS